MTLKIEKIPLTREAKDNRQVRFAAYVDAIRDLKIGESFMWTLKVQTTHRLAVTIASRLLNREYLFRKEKNGVRIGRIA